MGKRLNHNGYFEVYMPGHHRARGNGYVFEHIIVLEEKLGRKLKVNEQTHHVDGIRTNNHPENLEAVDISDHAKITAEGRKKKNMVACKECGKKVYRKPYEQKKNKNVYCSRRCLAIYGRKNSIKGRFNYAK